MFCGLLVRSEVVMMRLLVCSNPVVKVVMMLKSASSKVVSENKTI